MHKPSKKDAGIYLNQKVTSTPKGVDIINNTDPEIQTRFRLILSRIYKSPQNPFRNRGLFIFKFGSGSWILKETH